MNNQNTNNDNPVPSSSSSKISLDFSELSSTIVQTESQRQKSFDIGSQLRVAVARARHAVYYHTQRPHDDENDDSNKNAPAATKSKTTPILSSNEHLSSLIQEALRVDRRPPSLSHGVQDYIRLQAYCHFLDLAADAAAAVPNTEPAQSDGFRFLLPPSSSLLLQSASSEDDENNKPLSHPHDEDYLMGIMGLTQDLSRHAIQCGTNRDVHSVTHARNTVREVLEYLMKFDFRNGLLRRKYDGVKYALKTCETVLYELSVTGCQLVDDEAEHRGKRLKTNTDVKDTTTQTTTPPTTTPTTTIQTELSSIRQRMEHRDNLREKLIKRCRDAQKKAKQAIYTLHRRDYAKADVMLRECETIIQKHLMPIVEEDPGLRIGSSLGGVLEEYAEGILFRTWILGMGEYVKSKDGGDEDKALPHCTLLQPHQITSKVPVSTEEYLGGICDLTGEIGRYAVQRGTARDSNGVRQCLDTNRAILHALETIERLPSLGGIGKKMEPLRYSVEKLERMCYELSLVGATGRSIVVDSVKEFPVGKGDDD